jgi:predicted anti-sigma-YlaC factor YlaD
VSDYLEGALRGRDRRRLEHHLAGCDACSGYLEQMKVTIALSGSVGPEDLAPEALSRLVDVFEKYQRDKSGEPPT